MFHPPMMSGGGRVAPSPATSAHEEHDSTSNLSWPSTPVSYWSFCSCFYYCHYLLCEVTAYSNSSNNNQKVLVRVQVNFYAIVIFRGLSSLFLGTFLSNLTIALTILELLAFNTPKFRGHATLAYPLFEEIFNGSCPDCTVTCMSNWSYSFDHFKL